MSFLPYHRQSLRIASWFCIPEQGMRHYELLCRGTSFLVDSSSIKRNIDNDGGTTSSMD